MQTFTGTNEFLHPQGSRVLVIPTSRETTTSSGLFVPETSAEKPQQGEIIAVGSGDRHPDTGDRMPVDLAVGDKILFQKYAGIEFKHENIEYLVLSEKDVLAVFAKETTT